MRTVRRASSLRGWLFRISLSSLALVSLLGGRFSSPALAVDLKVGDVTITVDEGVELGYRERVVKKLPRGSEIVVTEVRDPWIGGEAKIEGETVKGWVHKRELRRAAIKFEGADAADEAAALAALKKVGVTDESDDENHVQVLDATDTGLPDGALVLLKKFPKLNTLVLSGTAVTDEGLAALKELKTLEFLYIDRTEITDKGLESLAGLENLVVLVLERTRVTGGGIASLKPLAELRTLNLGRCPVEDKQLEQLAELKNLEVVTLSNAGLKGDGLKFLQPLPKLRVLNISDNPIPEEKLFALKNAPILKMLYIRGMKVSDDTVEQLKATLNSCAVYRW